MSLPAVSDSFPTQKQIVSVTGSSASETVGPHEISVSIKNAGSELDLTNNSASTLSLLHPVDYATDATAGGYVDAKGPWDMLETVCAGDSCWTPDVVLWRNIRLLEPGPPSGPTAESLVPGGMRGVFECGSHANPARRDSAAIYLSTWSDSLGLESFDYLEVLAIFEPEEEDLLDVLKRCPADSSTLYGFLEVEWHDTVTSAWFSAPLECRPDRGLDPPSPEDRLLAGIPHYRCVAELSGNPSWSGAGIDSVRLAPFRQRPTVPDTCVWVHQPQPDTFVVDGSWVLGIKDVKATQGSVPLE